MTVVAIDRTVEQRLASLRLANEVRFARARMKRDLVAGRGPSASVLLSAPPAWLSSMRIRSFLMSIPKVGASKANRVLLVCRVSSSKTVGGLSDRQRSELVAAVEARTRR